MSIPQITARHRCMCLPGDFLTQEGDDYDEFAPLVIDTASVTDDYNDQSDLDTKMLPVGDSAPQAAPSGGESVDCPAVKFAMADGAKCAADKIGQPKVVWPAEGATGETKASGGVKEGVRLTSPSKTRRKSDKVRLQKQAFMSVNRRCKDWRWRLWKSGCCRIDW